MQSMFNIIDLMINPPQYETSKVTRKESYLLSPAISVSALIIQQAYKVSLIYFFLIVDKILYTQTQVCHLHFHHGQAFAISMS